MVAAAAAVTTTKEKTPLPPPEEEWFGSYKGGALRWHKRFRDLRNGIIR
jgi:hypothetical protein